MSSVSSVTNLNTTQFDTAPLNDLVTSKVPNLVSDLTTLRNNINSLYSTAAVEDLYFTPDSSGSTEQESGLNAYKTQLMSINTTLNILIGWLEVEITGNASLLAIQIQDIENDTIVAIVFILSIC
jgi:hypothetical protein